MRIFAISAIFYFYVRVNLNDDKVFIVSADDGDYDEEGENEMIKPEDLAQVPSLLDDKDKYKALHSHVEHYNRKARTSKNVKRNLNDLDPILLNSVKELNIFDEPKPYIAGFKHELDKLEKRDLELKGNHRRVKRHDEEEKDQQDDLNFTPETEDFQGTLSTINYFSMADESSAISRTTVSKDYEDIGTTKIIFNPLTPEGSNPDSSMTTLPAEEDTEDYNYESFKAEYYQELEIARHQNLTFNYTESSAPEETPVDAIKKIIEFKIPKNCTKEELSQIGGKAFECLVFDYQHAANKTDVKRVLTRSWMVIKVWLLIYVCVAIPAFCQKGWCCCCFRCKSCFPYETIDDAKRYYAENPPGVFQQTRKWEEDALKFEPTLFELDAYENLEAAIRNL